MALQSSILVLLVAMALCGACSGAGAGAGGAAYKVGGPEGWIIRGDYDQWSSTKEFHVGDTLLFSYNNIYHNVIEVTKQGFSSCDPSSPIAVYTSGSDNITLERPGHHYFLCGAPDHCEAGQKLDVKVSLPIYPPSPAPSASPVSSPTSAPSASPVSSPTSAPLASPVSSPSLAPSGLASPSTPPHVEDTPPNSAAMANAPKLALAVFGSMLLGFKLMF